MYDKYIGIASVASIIKSNYLLIVAVYVRRVIDGVVYFLCVSKHVIYFLMIGCSIFDALYSIVY